MHVSLHIGTEKTGTTTIQRFLALNRALLASEKILVPASLGATNHRLLPALVQDDSIIDDLMRERNLLEQSDRESAKLRWRSEFQNEVNASSAECCVISSEHL